MLRDHIERWMKWLKGVVTQPRRELDRWEAMVRFAYDLGVHGWRSLNQDNAPQMAAALAYRSLFALLPVIVVSAVIVKGVVGVEQFQQMGALIVDAAGLRDVRIERHPAVTDPHIEQDEASNAAPEPDIATEPAPESDDAIAATDETADASETTAELDETTATTFGNWIEQIISDLATVNLQALGWVGFAILVYAAITMMVTVENSFNTLYRAPQGRPWIRRVTTYWFVLTLGPGAIALMFYVNTQFDEWIHSVQAGQTWIAIGARIWSITVAWIMMFFVYWLIPNTRVAIRPVMIGAFVAAILLEIGRHSLGVYLSRAFSFSFFYGTLGFIPVFMFWLYLMWLVVLFGLEVSATIQYVQTHSLRELDQMEDKRPHVGLVDPAAVVVVMEVITERFMDGKPIATREIAEETRIPESVVIQILARLAQAGLVHWVEGDDRMAALARPPEQICADRLIEIGFSLVDEGSRRQSSLVQRLREAQRRLAEKATLASLLAPPPPPATDVGDQVPPR